MLSTAFSLYAILGKSLNGIGIELYDRNRIAIELLEIILFKTDPLCSERMRSNVGGQLIYHFWVVQSCDSLSPECICKILSLLILKAYR
jgi:hypothetical protein